MANLDNVSEYLDTLVTAVSQHVLAAVRSAHDAGLLDVAGHSAVGSPLITEAGEIGARLGTMRDAIVQNLDAVAASQRKAAEAIAEIAIEYRDVDERNRVAATRVGRLLR